MEITTNPRLAFFAPYPYPDRTGTPVYVYETSDGINWVAAPDEASALAHIVADDGGPFYYSAEDAEEITVRVLSAEEMDRVTFADDDRTLLSDEEWGAGYRSLSFRAALARSLEGETAPCFFATTEY